MFRENLGNYIEIATNKEFEQYKKLDKILSEIDFILYDDSVLNKKEEIKKIAEKLIQIGEKEIYNEIIKRV